MTEKNIIQKLAIERCRLNVSHLCALYFLTEQEVANGDDTTHYYHGLFETLNRDLSMIEDLLAEQSA